MKRSSGVLLHITSLPGRYGVGTLGNHARRFADFCHQARLSWWQILPVGPAGNGNSPYQSDSVFAGNPDLIDLEQLIEWGLLKREECDRLDWGSHADEVCFEKLHRNQPQLLRLAFARAKQDSYNGLLQSRIGWMIMHCILHSSSRWEASRGSSGMLRWQSATDRH